MPQSPASFNNDRELSLAVVGLQYPNPDKRKSNRQFEALICKPGEPVQLVPEPKNPADPRAVAVFSARGIQLGYLTAERCGWIGGKIKAGEEWQAVFQGIVPAAVMIRVRFGGDAPTLPPARPIDAAPADDDDFVPDPEGPEWGA